MLHHAVEKYSVFPFLETYRNESLKMEKKLENKSQEVNELKKQLDNKLKQNELLQTSLNKVKENHEESMRIKDNKIASLTSELDAKAGNIVYLTKQLHSLNRSEFTEISGDNPSLSPTPPNERAFIPNRKRYIRKMVSSKSCVDAESLSRVNPTAHKMLLNVKTTNGNENFTTQAHRVTHPAKGSKQEQLSNDPKTIPSDYSDFLTAGIKPEPKLFYKPVSDPLPPIATEIKDSKMQMPFKVPQTLRAQATSIVDEIIISPLNSPEKNWQQGSNTYDPVS